MMGDAQSTSEKSFGAAKNDEDNRRENHISYRHYCCQDEICKKAKSKNEWNLFICSSDLGAN
jgi:hypothetical protein